MSAETETTAEVLRSWAADAVDEMRAPLLELATHAEEELSAAKVAAEAAALGIVVEAFEVHVEPEAFAVRNAVALLRQGLDGSIAANKEFLTERDTYRSAVYRLARALGCLPDDHAVLDVEACHRRILVLTACEDKLAHIRETVTR